MSARPRARHVVATLSSLILTLAAVAGPTIVQAQSVTVRITDTLTPADVTVPRNTTVTFQNADRERHRIRTTSAPVEFDSGNLETGESFSISLTAIGTYRYHDDRDDENTAYFGQIVVSDSVTTTTVDPQAPPPTSPSAPTSVTVSIGDRIYAPAVVTVAPGGTVTWVNDDDRPHTVTADDRSFDSGIMNTGDRWSRTFPDGGTFSYFCELHTDMRGSVTVASSGGAAPPSPTPPPTSPPSTSPPPTTVPSTAPPPSTVPGAPAPSISSVTITGNRFSPATVTVVAGGTVTWTNTDAVPHTVTADDRSFDSGILRQSDSWSRTFTTVGTFTYFCELHPEMTGTVVVVPPGAPVPQTTAPPATTAPTPAPDRPPTATAPVTAPPVPGAALPSTGTVRMTGNRFAPEILTIAVGGTVTWVNDDAVPHTVTADDRSFDSGFMFRSDRWSRTFSVAGTYTYFCELHPEMTGTIVVTTPGSAAPPVVTGGGPGNTTDTSAGLSFDGAPPTTSNANSGRADPPDRAGVGAPGSASVSMGDNQFRPATVTVAAGGTVTWTNTDTIPHTVTAVDGSFDSGIMMPGATFSRRFDDPGSVDYRCILHPGMNGTVDVLASAASAGSRNSSDGSAGSVATAGDAAGVADSASGVAPSSGTEPDSREIVIDITGDDFPAVVTAVVGQTITWVNRDGTAHDIVANDGSFSSELLQPGERFSRTFDAPGAVPYHCTPHQHMRGVVVVLADDEAGHGATPTVNVTDTAFEPAELVVHQGDTVRWAFGGSLPHTVTADDGSFDSGNLEPGSTFTFTFDELGTFRYTCVLHPAMIATITVVPPDEEIPEGVSGISAVAAPTPGSTDGSPDGTPAAALSSGPSPASLLAIGLFSGIAVAMLAGIGRSVTRRRPAPAAPA